VNGEFIADSLWTFEVDEVRWGLGEKADRESSSNPFDLFSDAIIQFTRVAALSLKVNVWKSFLQ
jgi:hypothetical protein